MKKINTNRIRFIVCFMGVLSFFLISSAFALVDGDLKNAPNNILLNEIVVSENAANDTFIGMLSAVDPDNEIEDLTFFIPNDAGGRFEIAEGNSLQVKNGNEFLDYESDKFHEITILVRDPDWNTFTKNFTILVQNKNEAPTNILFESTAVDERVEVGTVVGTLTAIDPDSGDSHTFALANDAGGRFAVANGNQVVVLDGTRLMAESYDISVYVVDAVRNMYDKYFSVDVNPMQAPILSEIIMDTDEEKGMVFQWTTDKEAKSRIGYGLVGDISRLTPFTSNYTLSQEVAIPDLLDCVTHDYRSRSSDDQGKESVGTIATFTTKGCIGEANTLVEVQENVSSGEGGVMKILIGKNEGVQVNIPEGGVESEKQVQFQLKRLEVGAILQAVGAPVAAEDMYVLGTGIYDLQALSDVSTKLSNFQENIHITFSYSEDDVVMLEEETLSVYQWSEEGWEKLPRRCYGDTLNNMITCATETPGVFGVFGVMNDVARGYTGIAKAMQNNVEKQEPKKPKKPKKPELTPSEVLFQKRLEQMKSGALSKQTIGAKIKEEDELTQDVVAKLYEAQVLLEMYKIAHEEIALCETQEVGSCDEIYDFLRAEIDSREKQMIDHLMRKMK